LAPSKDYFENDPLAATTTGIAMQRFTHKTAIITGGANGIGRATALAFSREGAQVVIADIHEADATALVDDLNREGGRAIFVHTDTSSSDSLTNLMTVTADCFGAIDIYISNAGIFDDFSPCTEISDALWNRVINIDLTGYFLGARAVMPHLITSRGNIVMTASIAGTGALNGGTAYTAAKHGVVGLINQIACEVASRGVRVNGVAPGCIMTKMASELPQLNEATAWVEHGTPLGRWGTPEEVAEPILFLASEAARFITGTVLRVDGGWRSK
jgi:NAD(P)-dependent dehydrogenase (short-subunit alcohol dehydrogenase family)